MPKAAAAQTAPRIETLNTKEPITIESLEVGKQGMVGLVDLTSFRVAGYDITGGPARALAGQTADTVYLAVTSGTLTIEGSTADAGEMILIEPLKRGHQIQMYDAARLLTAFSEGARASHPGVVTDLEDIAADQSIGLFFGRYVTTVFNAQNPGSTATEEMRRQVVGSDAIRAIRFSGVEDPVEIERKVVAAFIGALRTGDVATVTELLDPTPYGGQDLRGGDAARQLIAVDLIASRDWAGTVGGTPVYDEEQNAWRVAGRPDVIIELRPVTDFAFVRTIK